MLKTSHSGRQKAEGSRQRAVGRRQKAGGRGRRADDDKQSAAPISAYGLLPTAYRLTVYFLLSTVYLLTTGCGQNQSGATTQPSTVYDRQEQALRDPYGYSPDLKKTDMSVTGNGEFDRDALKRDIDHVLNP